MEHPDDRIGDAGEDDENVHTDWSKVYEAENRVDSEISVLSSVRKRVKSKSNKVTFAENLPKEKEDEEEHVHNNKRTVFVELNPAALELHRKLVKDDSVDSKETEIFDLTSSSDNDSVKTGPEDDENLQRETSERDFTVEKLKELWSK